jgi:transcriptional regulator with XRE-family HTH domain
MLKKYQYVGKRIRDERIKYGLSLNDLAKATDLSVSFLSLLENGKTVPSLKVLDRLATYFSIHMAELFEEEQHEEVIFVAKNKQIEVATAQERALRFLLPKTKTLIEPVLITLFPKVMCDEFTVHKGIEFGYVLEGCIVVALENREPVTCKAGDSVLYQADVPHKLCNPGEKTAQGIWVTVPEANTIKTLKVESR